MLFYIYSEKKIILKSVNNGYILLKDCEFHYIRPGENHLKCIRN
ncbi:MAG: hypothetical protein ACI9RZ_000789, partial [Sphingobacteriales bacterium]